MNTSAVNNYYNSQVASVLTSALQGTSSQTTGNSVSGLTSDSSQLSPFAQLLTDLQQLQSNPTKYQQVTQQIATNLQNAAQTAQQSGNTARAQQLTQLATDFSNASKTGQFPSIQDLAQAIGSGQQHHHHAHSSASDLDSTSGDALNPAAIIMNTLSNSGLTSSQN